MRLRSVEDGVTVTNGLRPILCFAIPASSCSRVRREVCRVGIHGACHLESDQPFAILHGKLNHDPRATFGAGPEFAAQLPCQVTHEFAAHAVLRVQV